MARRSEILKAVYEADRLHKQFDSRDRAEGGSGRIDVFGMLVEREVPVMFRPLDKLLGAFIDRPDKGVIITSQRPLAVQRFTAAHELGHEVLGHGPSFDEEDIISDASFFAPGHHASHEVQANAFASQLLAPSWLVAQHLKRQGWTRLDLANPTVVYQLSLRMGSSYSATCYALEEGKSITRHERNELLQVKPKTIKRSLAEPYTPDKWYGDVWVITDRDNGTLLEGSRADLVVFKVQEHASSGYLWQLGDLADAGLAIRNDERASPADRERIGSVVFRTVIAESQEAITASGHLHLKETRPWEASPEELQSIEFDIDLSGPIPSGLLPEQRKALLRAA